MKAKAFLTSIFILSTLSAFSQDISGYWQGVLTQQGGIPNTYYPFSMALSQNGNAVEGTSEIRLSSDSVYFGTMSLTGTFDGSNFQFQEMEVIEELTGSAWAWCIKSGNLLYDGNLQKLEGPWLPLGCSPDTIEIYRLAVLSDTVFCAGAAIELEVTGQNIKWYSDEALNDLVATGNVFSPIIDASTTYYVTQTHYDTESPAVPINVIVSDPAITNTNTTPSGCQEPTGTISITADAGIGPLTYSIDGVNFESANYFEGLEAGHYLIAVQDDNNCVDTQRVYIAESLPIAIESIDVVPASCSMQNGFASVLASGGGTSLEYSLNDIDFQGEGVFDGLSEGTYAVFVRDENDCLLSDTFVVNRVPQLSIASILSRPSVCGESDGAMEIETEGGTGAVSVSVNGGHFQPVRSVEGLEAGHYTLGLRDEAGCAIDTLVSVTQTACPVFIPNAFSPNDDGRNDYFRVYPHPDFEGDFSMFRIFNRWGALIYEDQNFDPNTSGWDGRFKGKKLDEGVYIYFIKVEYENGETAIFEGAVSIMD